MICIVHISMFDAKIVDAKSKNDVAGVVFPKARRLADRVITVWGKIFY